jgi:hypothetical protein
MASFITRRIGQVGSLGTAIAGYGLWHRLSSARKRELRNHIEHLAGRRHEEIVPGDLTSPHTVSDPQLEERRAIEAAARERESRESSVTKFEELRQQQEAERAEHASALADAPD